MLAGNCRNSPQPHPFTSFSSPLLSSLSTRRLVCSLIPPHFTFCFIVIRVNYFITYNHTMTQNSTKFTIILTATFNTKYILYEIFEYITRTWFPYFHQNYDLKRNEKARNLTTNSISSLYLLTQIIDNIKVS